MWATADRPTQICLYKAFIQRQPPELYECSSQSLAQTDILLVQKFNRIMKELAAKGGIQGTNHSARKTMIQITCSTNIPDTIIMQLSGHEYHQSQSLQEAITGSAGVDVKPALHPPG